LPGQIEPIWHFILKNSLRRGEEMQKKPTAIFVVAAALVDGDGRILMQRRGLARQHGGLWEFPGGKIEPGEGAAQALARELQEELALIVDLAALAPVAQASDPLTGLQIELFKVCTWQGEPRCLEGETIGWFTWPELLALPMPPLDLPLAKALQKALAKPI
jgi:8-oxo-dGTP diphosphatase